MVDRLGNWDRPCCVCGITPQQGGQFHSAQVKSEGGARRRGKCKSCERAYRRNNYAPKDSRTIKDRNVRRCFGISLDEYERKFHEQEGSCAVCHILLHLDGPQRADKAQLDHNHETGELRSFLCPRCNVMLGMAQDDPEVLRGAAEYLEVSNGR